MRHWRARLCAGARARTRHRIFLRDTRIDARRSATDIPTNAHFRTRPFSPILSPSVPFSSLPPASIYLHSYGRAYRACIEASYVRTYVQKEGGRERERKRRERRLTLESTIGERVCARVVDDAPRTRVKSRGEGIPALPLPPRRRGVHRVSLRPTYPPSSSFSPLAAPALPPRPPASLPVDIARARRAYTPPAARGAVSRVAAGGAGRRRG